MNTKPEKELLEKLYLHDGNSMSAISSILNISVGAVHKYIHEYGIEARPEGWQIGRERSQETKEKIRIANMGKTVSENTRTKISVANKKGGIGAKKISAGYVRIYFPDHPRETKDGFVMEHDLVMECLIGR